MLITADRAEELHEQIETESEDGQGSSSDDDPQDEGESEEGESGEGESGEGEPGEGEPGEGEPPEEKDDTVQHLSLRVSGVPTEKISAFNKGVLMPLTRSAGHFEFTIEFNVKSEEGIPEKKIEQQVMETFRQLGAEVERKDVE